MTDPFEQRIRRLVRDLMGMAPEPPDVRSAWPTGANLVRRRTISGGLIVVAGAVVAAVAIGLPLLLNGNGESARGPATTTTGWQLTESQEEAASVGIVEHPPARVEPGYVPAPVPYLAVTPLSDYLGLDTPVVPETAVVTRDGHDVVFVVASDLFYTDRYVSIQVEARPVTTGERIGRAIVVEQGLNGCDIVIAAPPADLVTGATIPSYAEEAADTSLEVDYGRLLPGISRSAFSLGGGYLRPGSSPGLVFMIVNQRGGIEIPDGSTLVFQPAAGPERRLVLAGGIPEATGVEFEMPIEYLVTGERVGAVQVISPSGETIASGKLDWWCP
jgi:hypothetical protein